MKNDRVHKKLPLEPKASTYDDGRYRRDVHRETEIAVASQSYIAWDAVWDLVKNVLAVIGAYVLIGAAVSFFFGIPWMVIIGLTMIGGVCLLIVAAALAAITLA